MCIDTLKNRYLHISNTHCLISQGSVSTLQLALYYLLRIRCAAKDFAESKREWRNVTTAVDKKSTQSCARSIDQSFRSDNEERIS